MHARVADTRPATPDSIKIPSEPLRSTVYVPAARDSSKPTKCDDHPLFLTRASASPQPTPSHSFRVFEQHSGPHRPSTLPPFPDFRVWNLGRTDGRTLPAARQDCSRSIVSCSSTATAPITETSSTATDHFSISCFNRSARSTPSRGCGLRLTRTGKQPGGCGVASDSDQPPSSVGPSTQPIVIDRYIVDR